MIRVELTSHEIPALEPDDSHENEGSEIIFHGRVRRIENNEDIIGLEYEHYPGMTEKKLNELAEQTVAKFGISEISCIHRVGLVRVGEISVRIVIWSGHRTEGLTALDWFIVQTKKGRADLEVGCDERWQKISFSDRL